MKPFNVLDRSLKLHQHHLIEASAGTGKTFSIQNLVVRLLIEARESEEPLLLHNILIVTFTKAATRDLKARIRLNIEQALRFLEIPHPCSQLELIPDYLRSLLEKGEKEVHRAKKLLQQALLTFDQAQIFTIHAFCARMLRQFALEADIGLHMPTLGDPLPSEEIRELIRDFFLTEIHLENYSPAQIEIILKGDPDQKNLLRLMKGGYSFPTLPAYHEIYSKFKEEMLALKTAFSLSSNKMIEDFQNQADYYRNYSKESKGETLSKVTKFAQLFDQQRWDSENLDLLIRDGLVWVKALNPQLAKKNLPTEIPLHYPKLTFELNRILASLIHDASDFSMILARLANDCHHYIKRYQQEEEKFSPDDLLRKMHSALGNLAFLAQVRASYQAAIIDEFQDTDPLQWKIFKKLFLPDDKAWKGYLYLVGDPKQSIYSFRQADIYTYLGAAHEIGEANQFSLNVNYRSQPKLVEALNVLFDKDHLPHFVPLPKKMLHLACPPVLASPQHPLFSDDKGAIHFFIADAKSYSKPTFNDLEENVFFPFISKEIVRLKQQKEFTYNQFAVLVKDRHQALRLAKYFEVRGIPFVNQRGMSLANDPALQSMIQLLSAVLHSEDRSATYAALGSPLLGWQADEIKNPEAVEFIVGLFQHFKRMLYERGFAFFFQEMLASPSKQGGSSILNQLLARKDGIDFYHNLQQIADLIIDHQYIEWNTPEGIILFLDQLHIWEQNEDERIKRFQDPTKNGVKILTLHVSKGLEFDVVFALGLINRHDNQDELIPIEVNEEYILSPFSSDDVALRYREECDSEKMRLLYVAFTRAKKQLYVPIILNMPSETLEWGMASPIDLFLSRINQPPASYQLLYERMTHQTGKALFDLIEQKGENGLITYSQHDKITDVLHAPQDQTTQIQLHPPQSVSISGKPLWMTSFSSLSQQIEHKVTQKLLIYRSFPNDYESKNKDLHTLPANSETGVMIHALLEKMNFLDFSSWNQVEEVIPIIRPYLQSTRFKEWELTIATMLLNALKSPLPQIKGNFSLSMLEPIHQYREMPFLFPYHRGEGIEEVDFQEGMIKGVIDLLFTHQGLYYLVDWKTNWLGPSSEAYETTSLEATMKENSYFLQAAIYTEAMKRYLKLVEPRPFKECFGGIFYLFLRGMQPGKKTGIFHFY